MKEGSASLEVAGVTDPLWSLLGARYTPSTTIDLSMRSILAVWAKASGRTAFSVKLHDFAGNTRTFWDIQVYGSSTYTQWKRFAVNLDNYTTQTPDFDPTRVEFIDFYVSSEPEKNMSLWIDDLVVDDLPIASETIYKARVLTTDALVAYFYLRISTP
jgi:hypothetical protein